MTENEVGRVPLAPGSREPSQQAVSAASGFDPSRGMSKDEFFAWIDELRQVMKPIFDRQNDEWADHGPAAMEAFNATGATLDSLGGNCPVQGDGEVDGKRFYFRARGDEWQFHVGADDEEVFIAPCFYREGFYGSGYAAGWMPKHEALGLITQMIGEYRASLSPRLTRREG